MTGSSEFDDLESQLPFYVNGTIDADSRAAIDAALPHSPELRAALADVTALQQQVKTAGSTIADDNGESEQRLEALMARLPQQDARATAPRPAPASARRMGLAAALSMLSPKRWVPAVALSLAVAVGVQGVALSKSFGRNAELTDQLAQMTQNYQSASGPCENRAVAGQIALELKDSANWSQIADLLDAEQLVIVDSGGFGTLTVASAETGAAFTAQIARLSKAPLVSSAAAAK